jgi:hypothetical protein
MKVLSGYLNAKVGREYLKNIENESVLVNSNDSKVIVIKFATSKSLIGRVQCFYITTITNSCTLEVLVIEKQNHIYHALIDKRQQTNVLYVRFSEEMTVIQTIFW